MTRTTGAFCLPFLALMIAVSAIPAGEPLTVTARSCVDVLVPRKERKPDGTFVEKKVPVAVVKEQQRVVDPAKCAVVICDMWDDHWCKMASKRCDALAKQAAPVVEAARKAGMTIVHCPSDCMAAYKDHPARLRTLALKPVEPPKSKELPDPPLPIDDSDGGCDDVPQPKMYRAWSKQHAAIGIDDGKDFITDSGKDVYAILKSKGLETVFVMGVHTNMCVLKRTFAIKQLRKWDVPCFLVRDLTDAMYNPAMPPKVSHEAGTNLVIGYIEKHWCPTVLSKDLLAAK